MDEAKKLAANWKYWLAVAVALFLAPIRPAWCQTSNGDGGTSSVFSLGAGARALGMGSAFVAIADDSSALFWNPAGLAATQQIEFTATHIQLFFDTPYDFLGGVVPILDWGAFGWGAARVATGGIVVRDNLAQPVGNSPGSLDMRQLLLAYARELPWGIRSGITFKVDQQRLLGDYTTGAGMDLGVQYSLPLCLLSRWLPENSALQDTLTLGASLLNLWGANLKLKTVADTMPLENKIGLGYRLGIDGTLPQTYTLSCEFSKSTWQDLRAAVGLEIGLFRNFALRGGWNAYGWSSGIGGNYYGVYLDYALSSETLGLSHRFSLTYRWGPPLAEQAKIRAQRLEAKTDQRAQAIAQREMQMTKTVMESLIKAQVVRHAKEKRKIIETSRQLIQKQVQNQKRAVANEYFKALHYFRGIEDYMKKNYREARVEFDTVAKYDSNYMQLRLYLAKVKSMLDPSVQLLNTENSNYYYQGMDCYVQNNFEAAIEEWRKILVTQPNSVLALRNIEEAQERLLRIKEFEKEANQSKD